MTIERSQEIEFIRSEIIGPARDLVDTGHVDQIKFDTQKKFVYPPDLAGPGMPVFWRIADDLPWQEIIHYRNETPLNKYGSGMLFPGGLRQDELTTDNNIDNGTEQNTQELESEVIGVTVENESDQDLDNVGGIGTQGLAQENNARDDDFDVTSPDIYRPSTMGITFCLSSDKGELVIRFPKTKRFVWQSEDDEPFQVNGRYEKCEKIIQADGTQNSYPAWRRIPATTDASVVVLRVDELRLGQIESVVVKLPDGSPLSLVVEVFSRKINDQWIVTVVMRNSNNGEDLGNKESRIMQTLFQTYFEVNIKDASFSPYPEGIRPFDHFDSDEQSLALLYQDSTTWAIGHGCAAAWDVAAGKTPTFLYADVMPTVELPSMTPDIEDDQGNVVSLSMRDLSELPTGDKEHRAWSALDNLVALYEKWIREQRVKIASIDKRFDGIANRHMEACQKCQIRINNGINILRKDERARIAFKLANKSMLLQQIATRSKKLDKRPLHWNGEWVAPIDPKYNEFRSPSDVFDNNADSDVGSWRAFQIAFLLMSLEGLVNSDGSDDRDIVDLIWFPTGGGKTEAYLGVAAFYMFHQRLLMNHEDVHNGLKADGTNVFMRYTLRMLTTQQFQRAASLICSMEYIRVNDSDFDLGETRFSLGLWIGGDGSPNKCENAKTLINKFRKGEINGNPLVLTECPWCRSEIGRLEQRPPRLGNADWNNKRLSGFGTVDNNEPIIKCSDTVCHFGGMFDTLPIEVIDERIYKNPPSMFISTADKFAMLAYKPEAGSLFGKRHGKNGNVVQERQPPGLIIQDEFHLISGPLGTMYGVYEGVIEALCSIKNDDGNIIKPKIIASTATIRGAQEQVKAVYARENLQLFPSPGLWMKDSFFGRYKTQGDNKTLASGRLYLGIHAQGYGSFLTTQVRLFTAALFRSWFFSDNKKDAWWTLLAFYNSLRELGGARTLFSSDIASRLKNYSYRYGCEKDDQRYLNAVEELTSRRSQAELVQMMDRLSVEWNEKGALDACLASNIIEVGVDIERLSMMAVVGQPKSTAQYIQVTGRVGRKWWERPGLILAMYNPSKSRDLSHFEQFHSYHRRLYERVEPTSATPFSVEAIERAMVGALLLWARQFYDAETPGGVGKFQQTLEDGRDLLLKRCAVVVTEEEEQLRVMSAINRVYERLISKWQKNPQEWQRYPQKSDGEYLMLWPGQFSTEVQKNKGEIVPSSMRNVDGNAYLHITQEYILEAGK